MTENRRPDSPGGASHGGRFAFIEEWYKGLIAAFAALVLGTGVAFLTPVGAAFSDALFSRFGASYKLQLSRESVVVGDTVEVEVAIDPRLVTRDGQLKLVVSGNLVPLGGTGSMIPRLRKDTVIRGFRFHARDSDSIARIVAIFEADTVSAASVRISPVNPDGRISFANVSGEWRMEFQGVEENTTTTGEMLLVQRGQSLAGLYRFPALQGTDPHRDGVVVGWWDGGTLSLRMFNPDNPALSWSASARLCYQGSFAAANAPLVRGPFDVAGGRRDTVGNLTVRANTRVVGTGDNCP